MAEAFSNTNNSINCWCSASRRGAIERAQTATRTSELRRNINQNQFGGVGGQLSAVNHMIDAITEGVLEGVKEFTWSSFESSIRNSRVGEETDMSISDNSSNDTVEMASDTSSHNFDETTDMFSVSSSHSMATLTSNACVEPSESFTMVSDTSSPDNSDPETFSHDDADNDATRSAFPLGIQESAFTEWRESPALANDSRF